MKLFFLIIFCIIIPFASAMTIEEQAEIIYYNSTSELNFADNVNIWIGANIRYNASDSRYVNSTNITWENRVGDCSEIAWLGERMLKPYIDAHVVSGMVGTYPHDTVRLHIDKIIRYMDHATELGFDEMYTGLDPSELVIE